MMQDVDVWLCEGGMRARGQRKYYRRLMAVRKVQMARRRSEE